MGPKRKDALVEAIEAKIRPDTKTLLDVGCGLAEIVDHFKSKLTTSGADVIDLLCKRDDVTKITGITSLNNWGDNSVDIVVCSDVLEHIEPEETLEALRELWRITKQTLVIHVAWHPSIWNGIELHINCKPGLEWRRLVKDVCSVEPEYSLPDHNKNLVALLVVSR
jgi:hypothetical protein